LIFKEVETHGSGNIGAICGPSAMDQSCMSVVSRSCVRVSILFDVNPQERNWTLIKGLRSSSLGKSGERWSWKISCLSSFSGSMGTKRGAGRTCWSRENRSKPISPAPRNGRWKMWR